MIYTKAGKRSLIAVLTVAALLAACGHHDDDNNSTTQPTGSTPPPAVTDAFVSSVSQVVATQSDTTEAASTDGIAATTPEDTEPQPLPGP